MKKSFQIILIVFLLFIGDRFLFMSNRLNGVWEYETGSYIGDPISKKQNMNVRNNFEIQIYKNDKLVSYYLLGCYFGELYLLEKETLKYTRYTAC
ncbi:hypothetical protein [Flavobacterium undicola]|uniref:hypothetical protein n=1 Tax=Flavobacterium undicola TaxID=1932779 RepID=UPI001378F83C|nr:hypothetical protein [Flavobacterium undicola]MBA0884291.1 hypothetical protein [Flavobacterium undicola]